MFETVNKLLEQYIGGQIFFTELDKAVKFNKEILLQLVDAVKERYPHCLTIASGEIGLSMHNLGVNIDYIVPGGLRFEPEKINLKPFAENINNKLFVFIDDSYFSGKTALVVKEEIEKYGGTLLGAYVAYDGSKEKNHFVNSLYRYYDHYDLLGRPIKEEVCE